MKFRREGDIDILVLQPVDFVANTVDVIHGTGMRFDEAYIPRSYFKEFLTTELYIKLRGYMCVGDVLKAELFEINDYDTLSNDGVVGFIDDIHKYEFVEDPKKYQFTSATTFIKDFVKAFDAEPIAKAYVKNHDEYKGTWQELAAAWTEKGRVAAEKGTLLHLYGEHLWQYLPMHKPGFVESEMVEDFISMMRIDGYECEQVERLVYNLETKKPLAGLIDMLLYKLDPKTGKKKYYIYDYKFVGKPLAKYSFWSKADGYTYMKGPFASLHDCNFYKYSIQQAMYEFLVPEKIEEKVLVQFTPKSWKLIPCHDIKFERENGQVSITIAPIPRKKKSYNKK